MNPTRPICFLDIESATRGPRPDPAVDKIITLSIIKVSYEFLTLYPFHFNRSLSPDDARKYGREWRFNPGFEMSPENIAIHGVSNEEAAKHPLMTVVDGKDIQAFLAGADIGGFNCTGYDNPLLWEECFRVGVALDFTGVKVVDVGTIFKKKEERSLEAGVKFYCGREHIAPHDPMADVVETINVLKGQMQRYPDIAAMDVPQLAEFSTRDRRVDLFGTIVLNDKGEPVYNTKRNQGVRVADDPGYGEWIMRNSFPANTHKVLREILDQVYNPPAKTDQDTLF